MRDNLKTQGIQSWSARLTWIIDTFEAGNASGFARKVGLSSQGATDYRNTETIPGGDKLEAIVRAYPVNPQWLLTGEGSPELPPPDTAAQEAFHRVAEIVDGVRSVTRPAVTPTTPAADPETGDAAHAVLTAEREERLREEDPPRKRASGNSGRVPRKRPPRA
jgi:transcriptional regulator with XRE-family HTH domain